MYPIILLCLVQSICSFFGFSETVSVVVPCCYKHFSLLPELMNNLSLQTRFPDEVVISLSESNLVQDEEKVSFMNRKYPFTVLLLTYAERKYAGSNRNSASEHSQGDITLY